MASQGGNDCAGVVVVDTGYFHAWGECCGAVLAGDGSDAVLASLEKLLYAVLANMTTGLDIVSKGTQIWRG
jgi:hypothetical protein